MIKSNVHDTRVGGIDGLDLVFVQRACWEVVVVLLPPLLAVIAYHGPTAKQPLGGCPFGTNILDAFIIYSIGKRTKQLAFTIIISFLTIFINIKTE